jgi:putative ABC transport system permease protein
MEIYIHDIRFAFRTLTKSPAFAAIAALTLGLGIGANTAIFSVVNSVLLSPLPYPDPDRIVMVCNRWQGFDKTWLSNSEYLDYREQCSSFEEVAAWATTDANLTGGREPERVTVGGLTASLFPVLGVEPILGRAFSEDEDLPGKDQVAVLSYGLWQRRFGGDPTIIGKTIELDGRSRTILGIMPALFKLPLDFGEDGPTDLWIPLAIDPGSVDRTERGNHYLYSAARLAPGTNAEQATAELQALTTRFTEEGLYPVEMRFESFTLSVSEEIVGEVRPALLLLLGAVGFLLLIACANVANLLLTRAEARSREMAVRAAIGASRSRILCQLLTESIVLSIIGGAVGSALTYAGSQTLLAWNPASIPRVTEVTLNLPVLFFALIVSVLTGVLFGLAPVLHVWKLELTTTLKEGGRATTAGLCRHLFRRAVVVVEVALAVTLLIGAGLMLKSFWNFLDIDPGFQSDSVLIARLSLPQADYPEPEDIVSFYEELLDRLRALPGVEHTGAARTLPLTGTIGDWGLRIEGRPSTRGNHPKGDWQVVSPGYFEAMGMKLIKGRFLTYEDRTDALQVAVINETMVSKYWSDEDPLGQRIRMGSGIDQPWITVVGVVGDVTHNGIDVEIKQKFYRPHAQFHRSVGFAPRAMTLVVKATSEPVGLASLIRSEVGAIDPNIPLADVRTMDDVLAASVSEPRFTALLLGVFAAVALVLAVVGIYGVIAYSVSRRSHEIGIRMALGARSSQVLTLILQQGFALSAVGLALGIALALGVTRLMAGLLYGVGTTDMASFTLIPAGLMLTALLASYIPARRAARVDPVASLRME